MNDLLRLSVHHYVKWIIAATDLIKTVEIVNWSLSTSAENIRKKKQTNNIYF